jgi:hypothetical protein
MTEHIIILGGEKHEIKPIPLGRLKKLIPAMSEASVALSGLASGGVIDESAMDKIAKTLALALDRPQAEIEELPMGMTEMTEAIGVIAVAAGLVMKEFLPGEALTGSTHAETLTPSTPSLPTS